MNTMLARNMSFNPRRQTGIAVVEFAVGVIILLALMLLAAEAGRAYFSFNTLTKAVRNAARYISTEAIDDDTRAVNLTAQKITETRNMVIYGLKVASGPAVLPNMVPGTISVVQVFPSGPVNPYIRVLANYGYQPLFGSIPALGLGGQSHDFTFTMQAATTMRVLR